MFLFVREKNGVGQIRFSLPTHGLSNYRVPSPLHHISSMKSIVDLTSLGEQLCRCILWPHRFDAVYSICGRYSWWHPSTKGRVLYMAPNKRFGFGGGKVKELCIASDEAMNVNNRLTRKSNCCTSRSSQAERYWIQISWFQRTAGIQSVRIVIVRK